MNSYINEILEEIKAGKSIDMDDGTKNLINSIMADGFEPGDRVKIIKTGQIGVIIKKIPYDRESQKFVSQYGYTAIQVDINGTKHNYAPRSLKLLERKGN